jgi:hypothetical protein
MVRLPKALLAILFLSITSAVFPETPPAPAPAVEQIVDRMGQHEAYQAKELKHYTAIRHYQVQYKGFATTLTGKMDVEVSYDDVSGKSFRILSQSGSKLLCDKVLKRAVESEKEASQDKQSTALTATNYQFRLIGTEPLDGRPTYILRVDPLRPGKFLYRGRIWVDAAEYAVDKIEVAPAKNPSFWISSTAIENTNSVTKGIWLPQKNRSESKIRVGGTAVLTIDYGIYHVDLTSQPNAEGKRAPSGSSQITEATSSH